KPTAHRLLRRIRIRRQNRKWSPQPTVEHGDGRLIGIQQSEARMLAVELDLGSQRGKIVPAVHGRKYDDRGDAERHCVGSVGPLEATQHVPSALRLGGTPKDVPY